MTKYKDYQGNTVRYGYDELGNRISLTYPGGEIVRYEYDQSGLLTKVIDWNGDVTSYTRDENGRITKEIKPDGTTTTYQYDTLGQLTKQVAKKADKTTLYVQTYQYDLAGNVVKSQKQTGGKVNYDALTTINMTYDSENRLATYNGQEVTYDDNGNMIYGPLDGKMTTFTYDVRNRLISAGNQRYEYDAENNRIATTTVQYQDVKETDNTVNKDKNSDTKEEAITLQGITTHYVYDTNQELSQVLLEETEGETEVTETKYLYGKGLIAEETKKKANKKRTTTYYIHHYDNIGSTIALTDKKGNTISLYEYGTYGELLAGDTSKTKYLYNVIIIIRGRFLRIEERPPLYRSTQSLGTLLHINEYPTTLYL